jgi:hypothetical protein
VLPEIARTSVSVLVFLRLTGRGERHAARRLAHRARVLEQVQPGRREREAAPDPLEQRHAQLFLERGDLPAECGLRHAKGPRRGRERPFFSGDEERAGAVPIKGDWLPIHAFPYR